MATLHAAGGSVVVVAAWQYCKVHGVLHAQLAGLQQHCNLAGTQSKEQQNHRPHARTLNNPLVWVAVHKDEHDESTSSQGVFASGAPTTIYLLIPNLSTGRHALSIMLL
jgi:hypothetical protein